MAVEIRRDPTEQIEQLVGASNADVQAAKVAHVRNAFAQDFGFDAPDADDSRFEFVSGALEVVGLDLLTRYARDATISRRAWHDLLWPAFRLRRLGMVTTGNAAHWLDAAINGVLAHRQPELRLALQGLPLNAQVPEGDWDKQLMSEISRALLLVIRKQGGYADVTAAREIIDDLRAVQDVHETQFLGEGQDMTMPEQAARITSVVALYNVAKIVELAADFTAGEDEAEEGQRRLTAQGVKDEVDSFAFSVREALSGRNPELRRFADRVSATAKALIDASIFSAVMPPRTRALLTDLAGRETERPILELWYAQREALNRSLLDPARSAIVISMPTSAGKTLLAELAITQSLNDNPGTVAVYVAPTKALVTQASLTLRRDLVDRGLVVRVATPVFELDPVEAEVLAGDFDILVTTPEKLDLLVREEHPAVAQMSLVVVDEAHNISDRSRGARLELLLATLRRERPESRFLLMTPFADNAAELARWLGGERGTPIVLDWKPNDRVVGTIEPRQKVRGEDRRELIFRSLESAHSDCPPDEEIFSGYGRADMSAKKRVAIAASVKWAAAREGGVLLLASTRTQAEERARAVADELGDPEVVPRSIDLVTRFLNAEAGGVHPLSGLMTRGVAFHHAGLSTEARYFVERLVEEGAIKVLCATTTLAQGVHFPLSAAVIESAHRSVNRNGNWFTEELKPWEFWNIAGRVGRTLEDELGVVCFAARGAADRVRVQDYLRTDASHVSSSLVELLEVIEGWDEVSFSRSLVERVPAASAFLQYVLHAIAVAGEDALRTDVEALVRGSLLFEQAQADRPELADALIRFARLYADELAERKGPALRGFVKMADGTGFSSPSVDLIFGEWRTADAPPHPLADWLPGAFFPDAGHSRLLQEIVDTLHRVPETHLGSEDSGAFSAERIARITTSWVGGISLADLANQEYGGDLLKCAHHVYGTITNIIPWGLRAVQRVALAGQEDEIWNEISLIPGMIFHGVQTREAIALRMLSVPRIAAEGLAGQWRQGEVDIPTAGDWLSEAGPDIWQAALQPNAGITGAECKRLWEILEGRRSWRDLLAQ